MKFEIDIEERTTNWFIAAVILCFTVFTVRSCIGELKAIEAVSPHIGVKTI